MIRNYAEEMIRRVECINEKSSEKIVYRNKSGVDTLKIPEDYTKIRLFKDNGDTIDIPVGLLKEGNSYYEQEDEELEELEMEIPKLSREDRELLNEMKAIHIWEIVTDQPSPKFTYEDITESIMFDFPPINQSVLTANDNGLWAWHGARKFELFVSNLMSSIDDSDVKIKKALYFETKDSEEIPRIEVKEFFDEKERGEDLEPESYRCYAYIDTNRLGEEFDEAVQTLLFSGYYELSVEWEDDYDDIAYCFPIQLVINNTNYIPDSKLCRPLQNKTVSIDFGTSSSCVAVEGINGVELLTLSSDERDDKDNIYENPTCIMIHRWKEIYEQWRKENRNFPLIIKGDAQKELENVKIEFDFGYSVKDCLNSVNDEELNAILTEIKMIPSYLYDGEQRKIRPHYRQDKPTIDLVASPEEQDENGFDPVAFYAYIIGRTINNVAKNRIYTKFDITYPVKFNEELREKIRHSMEYGLKRSLPLPLRDAVDKKGKSIVRVKMNQPEPVAYIGAVCGKYLKIKDDKPELFAVFDFGGGTLDYSFGIFALDPEDEENTLIYILGVDGDSNIGGETLIKRISYWVYIDDGNRSEMTDREIQFELPIGEILPDDCKDKLFNKSADAMSNVRKINEKISREIFEGRKEGSGTEPIDLVTLRGEEEAVDISYDAESLNGKLEKILREKVENFKRVMNEVFTSKSDLIMECGRNYQQKDVKIFKAGNSSKNKILEGLMKEAFPENEINLIDETDSEWMMDMFTKDVQPKKVALTPKTAVAFGQINLQNFEVKTEYIKSGENGAPFGWYVGSIRKGNNQFMPKIKRSTEESAWVQYCKVNSVNTKIYYSEVLIDNVEDSNLRSVEIELDDEELGNFLFVRVVDSNTIEYTVCEKGRVPENGEYNKENIVKLK